VAEDRPANLIALNKSLRKCGRLELWNKSLFETFRICRLRYNQIKGPRLDENPLSFDLFFLAKIFEVFIYDEQIAVLGANSED